MPAQIPQFALELQRLPRISPVSYRPTKTDSIPALTAELA